MQGKEPRKMSNLLVTDGVDDSVLELWNSAAKTASRVNAPVNKRALVLVTGPSSLFSSSMSSMEVAFVETCSIRREHTQGRTKLTPDLRENVHSY